MADRLIFDVDPLVIELVDLTPTYDCPAPATHAARARCCQFTRLACPEHLTQLRDKINAHAAKQLHATCRSCRHDWTGAPFDDVAETIPLGSTP